MSEETEDKQYEPTQKRLTELKTKGKTLRAKDYSSGMMFISGILILLLLSSTFFKTIQHIFLSTYANFNPSFLSEEELCNQLKSHTTNATLLLLPIGFVLIAVIFLANFLLGGLTFSKDSLKFKGERINLFKNLKNMFALSKLFEVGKSILKIAVFFGSFAVYIHFNEIEIISLSTTRDSHVLIHGFEMMQRFLLWMIPGIVLLMLVDAIHSFFSFRKKSKMSFKELKDERKNTEGSPEVKQKLRAKQHAAARLNMQRDVPKATVVITNPTHFAVALKYEEHVDAAPKIMAKGKDSMAQEIRRLAIKSGVPIYQAPPLARAIYHSGKVGGHINEELYRAVAIVLAYIAQLKQYQQGHGQPPNYVQDLPIPEEYKKKID